MIKIQLTTGTSDAVGFIPKNWRHPAFSVEAKAAPRTWKSQKAAERFAASHGWTSRYTVEAVAA